jgi:PilZ domain
MSDPATTARTAREALSRGLNALQSDPSIPPALVELAAPIAQSMGALHQIERTNGAELLPHATVALDNVRNALAKLQTHASSHPAVGVAIEAVASSLGHVHALSKLAANPQAAAAAAIPLVQQVAPQQVVPQQAAPQQAAPQQVAPQQAAPQQAAPQQAAPAYVQTPVVQQPYFPPPQQQQQPQQQIQSDPFAAPQQHQHQAQGGASPLAVTAFAPAGMSPQQAYVPPAAPAAAPVAAAPARVAPAPAPAPAPGVGGGGVGVGGGGVGGAVGDMPAFNADLGAQSSTNFYKGLSGNDIIDHGGLFVSTYMIPKLGTPVRLKVSLPGGYEFEANAVVRWRRDASDSSGSDAPPGFGAQFTQITPEARQLVYRYVRNREPLFHDDL